VCLCVCRPFQVFEELTDLHKVRNEICATGGHPNMAIARTNMRTRSLSDGIQYGVLKWWTVICGGERGGVCR